MKQVKRYALVVASLLLAGSLVAESLPRYFLGAPQRVTQPVHVALLVPSDYTGPLNVETARLEVERWTELVRQWVLREVGLTFDSVVTTVYSSKTLLQLQGGAPQDTCGKGAVWGQVLDSVRNDGGFCVGCEDRQWIVMLGAGGWAGAYYYGNVYHGEDLGIFLLGDWGLDYILTGVPDACDPWRDFNGGWRAFGHEAMHTMNVPIHWEDFRDPYACGYYTGDALCDEQKRELKKWNKAFLRVP